MHRGVWAITSASRRAINALQHVQADVPDLREAIPDAPDSLVAAIDALMSKEPDDRPASARAALELFKGLPEALLITPNVGGQGAARSTTRRRRPPPRRGRPGSSSMHGGRPRPGASSNRSIAGERR